MSFVYGVGIIMSLSMAVIIVNKLYKALIRKTPIDELQKLGESEEIVVSQPLPSSLPLAAEKGGS